MMLWASWRDYTDGLEPNLVAEFAGLLASVVVTYVIVSRIVQRRLRSQNRPLLVRLRERIDYAVGMMAFSWGVVLGMANASDAVDASRGAITDEVRRRLESSDGRGLVAEMRSRFSDGPQMLGTFMLENADRVVAFSDRVSHVTAEDIGFEERLADFNEVVEDIAIAVRHWHRIEGDSITEAEVGLAELCKGAFVRALELKRYADEGYPRVRQ